MTHLELFTNIFESYDCMTITNRDGIVEYSVRFDYNKKKHIDEGYTGKHISQVYPNLKEEESTFWRVLRSGEPIKNGLQTIQDYTGTVFQYITCAYPMFFNDSVIAVVEGNTILSINGERYDNRQGLVESRKNKYYTLDDIITGNSQMLAIKEKIKRIATGDAPVLIIGETGTGKELVAQSVHSHSLRSSKPFVAQNCSAIPSELLESILFGTVKGSYTGAVDRKGLFEAADGGSLFLDELNSLDIALQGKVLKALETNRIRRVGSEKEVEVNVRIISAMNEDPFALIEEKRMRKDLFYRLGVVQVELPQLRERKEDIILLVHYLINHFNQEYGRKVTGLSEIVERNLLEYHWPGNVRELRNTVEYAYNVMTGDVITIGDLPEYILHWGMSEKQKKPTGFDLRLLEEHTFNELVEEYEKSILKAALSQPGNLNAAAKRLHLTRQVLRYKMEKYQLTE